MRPLTTSSMRAFGLALPPPPLVCRQCLSRAISTTAAARAGHNKWSKVKHRKAVTDRQKIALRAQHSKMIALYSRLYGTDSPQMANAVALAKKAGVPKGLIEGAVARGQGRSLTGNSLEPLTLEVIMPPGVAIIVEAETDNKIRSLENLRLAVKKHKGRSAASSFFFSRLGCVVFEAQQQPQQQDGDSGPTSGVAAGSAGGGGGEPVTVDEVMDEAIEAGAEDLETDEDGNVVVWTQPSNTSAVTNALSPRFGGRVLSSGIVWSANEDTKVKVEEAIDADALADLFAVLQEHPEVQAIYANATKGDAVSDEAWSRVEEGLGG